VEESVVVAKTMAVVVAAMDTEEVGVVTLPGKRMVEEERLGELLQSSQEIPMEVDQCKTLIMCVRD
jgi:hypothetical protein